VKIIRLKISVNEIIDTPNRPTYNGAVTDGPCPGVADCGELGSSLQDDLCWLLVRASRGMGCAMSVALAARSLDTRGLMVLKTICETSAPNQLALAQAADIDKTTLVAVLDDLERKRLVRRVPDVNDRRARAVELTGDGRQMLAWAEAAGGDIQRTVLDSLEPTDRDAILRSLPLIINAIDGIVVASKPD
jgi:MarR family transcriptional regulator for hemolysin